MNNKQAHQIRRPRLQARRLLDCRFVAAAFTTYGGWGEDFKTTLVDPYYKKEFKAARKNGESGWAVINDRLRYERHVARRGSHLPREFSHARLDARRPLPCQGNPTLCTAAISGIG